MNEIDDRLAGDAIWELFPDSVVWQAPASSVGRMVWWLAAASAIAGIWFVSPALAVSMACLLVSARDFRRGLRLARSIPDKAGGIICALFSYSWGASKFGVTALEFVIAILMALLFRSKSGGPLPHGLRAAFVASLLLAAGGLLLSATLTAAGLVRAYRSNMRVWIGEGVNQAGLLFFGMLLTILAFAVIVPIGVCLAAVDPQASRLGEVISATGTIGLILAMLVGPVAILIFLDRICKHVVADRPGKFGPKVSAVGKWNS